MIADFFFNFWIGFFFERLFKRAARVRPADASQRPGRVLAHEGFFVGECPFERGYIGLRADIAQRHGGVAQQADWTSFSQKVAQMFGIWIPRMGELEGIWGLGWEPSYRLPILALFVAMSLTLAIWPAQKNLGTLMSCSAAVMVATQFWHGYDGGTYMAWYLPLTLLTIFRPNLEDRVALTVLGKGWLATRRPHLTIDRAA